MMITVGGKMQVKIFQTSNSKPKKEIEKEFNDWIDEKTKEESVPKVVEIRVTETTEHYTITVFYREKG